MAGVSAKVYCIDGKNLVIERDGSLEVKSGAAVSGLPAATTSAPGTVKMAAKVAEAAGEAPTAAEFKALLDALIAAGIMSGA